MIWERLIELEPRVAELLEEARRVKDPGGSSFCANQTWFDQFDKRLDKLVGWYADGDPDLQTSEAYDVAFIKIYDVLPACRNCTCL
jgi:hypothetical protein